MSMTDTIFCHLIGRAARNGTVYREAERNGTIVLLPVGKCTAWSDVGNPCRKCSVEYSEKTVQPPELHE